MRGTYQVEFNTQEREREKREALEERPALLKKIERLEKELEKSRLITCTDTPAMTAEEQWEMRVYLALSHQDGKCLIYGDDGELQCNNIGRHGRGLDFRREPLTALLEAVKDARWQETLSSQPLR